jgi:hypothetical protein
MFLFGCTAALTVSRLRRIHVPLAIYTTVFLTASLVHTLRVNVRNVSPAVRAYLAALEGIPPGSTFIRVQFPIENVRNRFGYNEVALEPLHHADALAAVRGNLVALSDYQGLNKLFPVIVRPDKISSTQAFQLWDLEGTGTTTLQSISALLKAPPIPIDYVVVVGDQPPSRRGEEYEALIGELNGKMRLISGPAQSSFVRVYRQPAAR